MFFRGKKASKSFPLQNHRIDEPGKLLPAGGRGGDDDDGDDEYIC